MSGLSRSSLHASRMLIALVAGATMLAALALDATPTKAQSPAGSARNLVIKSDNSHLLRLPRPVAEIIIGNPTIADIAVQSKQLLVVTGKSFGQTNIILLDNEQNVIQENRVLVVRDQANVINLHRGTARESYNCAPRCNATITVGDEATFFKSTAETANMKMKMSEGNANAAGNGGQ